MGDVQIHRLPIVYDIPSDVNIINAFHEISGKYDNPFDEFVDICLKNRTWAAYHLLKWQGRPLELAPFQSVILDVLWNKTFPILLASRGAGKTFMLAVYAVLRAMLTPGSKIVIVASSFRQSKLVFEYIEKIYEYSPILQACSSKGIQRPPDSVKLQIGDSLITALPLGNGEKIRGIRACVSADTLIDTDEGLIEAREIVETPRDFSIYNADSFETPGAYCRTNITDVHEVETTYGFRIQFSDIHKINTDDGWKDIDELTASDRVQLHSSRIFPSQFVTVSRNKIRNEKKIDYDIPSFVNMSVGRILGYLISEGCVSNKNGTISFVNTEKEIVDDYCKHFERAFGVMPKIYERKSTIDTRGWKCKKSYEAKICRLGIRKYLEDVGLDYLKAPDKYIPWSILRSPRCVTVEFLKGLFEGDGTACLYKNSKRDTDEFYVAYYSASEKLCRQLQTLLLKFGLVGSVSKRAKGNLQYYLRFNRGYAAGFARDIGFISSRKTSICQDALMLFNPKYYDGRSIKIKKINRKIRKDVLYDVCMPLSHKFVGNGILNHNTHIITDEFASISPEVFQVVVRGFASVSSNPIEAAKQTHIERKAIEAGVMDESERSAAKSNQIVYSGTANYQFNHFYKLWRTHRAIIVNRIRGNSEEVNRRLELSDDEKLSKGYLDYRDYAIIQIPYNGLPESYMDEKQIAQARVTMPRALFEMEYECKFPTDSDGFYKRSVINKATPGHEGAPGVAFGVETKGQPGFEYVMGIDPARKTDNFAISILKLIGNNKYKNVYCYSMNQKSWPKAVRKVRNLLKDFNIVRVAVDAGGGGTTVEDLLQDPSFTEPGEELIWRIDEKEHRAYSGRHILEMVNFTSSWIAEANYGMASDIEHNRLLFPYRSLDVVSPKSDTTEEEIWDEIEEQINETCMIIVTPTKTGVQHFDIPELPASQQSTLKTYQRKDRYSALLLACYAARQRNTEEHRTNELPIGGWVHNL